MMKTIRHTDVGREVVAAKLLMGYLSVDEPVGNPEQFIEGNQNYDANFVAAVCTWQGHHNLTADGVIGPKTWAALAAEQPMCSTSKHKISEATLAIQILLDSQITCDGVYGKKTKAAVQVFQDAKKLIADGICGVKTWAALLGIAAPEPEVQPESGTFKSTVNYKQHDSRWGKNNYTSCGNKSQTMSNSGCGPTAMANVIATLVDKNVTPWDLAQLAMKWGDRTKSSGTAVSFFKHIQEHYGFKKMVGTGSIEVLKACLDAGGYVVCRMGPGYWTNGGHYITAWKYDSEYIYCNDPSSPTSKKAERLKQKQSDFLKQRKDFWCFYPEREGDALPFDGAEGEIIDISKHDGNIDFDALRPRVALVIARASLGSDIDEKFEEYAVEMNARSIPFGVYCYSYARDAAKGSDEAERIFSYAEGYKPKFYVMDMEEACIVQEGIIAFVRGLRELGVQRVGAYVAHHRYKAYGFDDLRGLFDFVWIPRYAGTDIGEPTGKRPDYACDLWQYTENGRIDGVKGTVDKNLITGTRRTLAWFTGSDA